MATDKAFHEWGRLVPEAVARLAGLGEGGGYCWRSLTVKGVERRLDGVLEPEEAGRPILFVEFQGYRDERFLLRWLQGIVTYLKEREEVEKIHVFVVYLSGGHEVEEALEYRTSAMGKIFLRFAPQSVVLNRVDPEELLQRLGVAAIPLLPLTCLGREELGRKAVGWAKMLGASSLGQEEKKSLTGLLGAFLSHRLQELSLEEIEDWLGGVKMEDTPLGQMLLERGLKKGREEGWKEGREEGREEGRISEARRMLFRALRRRLGEPSVRLEEWVRSRSSVEELEEILDTILEVSSMEELWERVASSS